VGKKLERFSYRVADVMTTVSKPMKAYIKHNSNSRKDISILYNRLDLKSLDSNFTDNVFENEKELKDKFVISYLGNIGNAQG
jgi:hypothetical protein